MRPDGLQDDLADFYRLPIVKSECFYDEYLKIAETYGTDIIDTSSIISASPKDGVHIEAEEHRRLGKELCAYINARYSLQSSP